MVKVMKEKQAIARRAELAAILASSDDAIVGLSPLGVIESWNPAAAQLYGYAAADMIGRNADVLVAPNRREEEAEILRRVIGGQPAERRPPGRTGSVRGGSRPRR